MSDVIVHGWEKPYTCIECPFKRKSEVSLGNSTIQTIYACSFSKEEDPWRSGNSMISRWLCSPCPIEELK